jgi:hypothetical protein
MEVVSDLRFSAIERGLITLSIHLKIEWSSSGQYWSLFNGHFQNDALKNFPIEFWVLRQAFCRENPALSIYARLTSRHWFCYKVISVLLRALKSASWPVVSMKQIDIEGFDHAQCNESICFRLSSCIKFSGRYYENPLF